MSDLLKVIRGTGTEPYKHGEPHQFIGDAKVYSVSEMLGTEQTKIRYVRFEPGARSRPHRHSKDQLLCFVGGPGIVAVDGGDDQLIQDGEFVLLPGGQMHMHGATDDTSTTHISMMSAIDSDFESEIAAAWEKYRG